MKKQILLLISCLIYSVGYCQTNINYSSFDAWRQNSSTKKMEHIKTIYKSGYIEIDNERATAIIYNSEFNQKELFQFTSFRKVENGHYLGFGKVDNQQMLTFIPEDSLLLLKVNDIVVMQFSLKQSDIFKLKKEFGSNVVNVNADYNEDNDTNFAGPFMGESSSENLVWSIGKTQEDAVNKMKSSKNVVAADYAVDGNGAWYGVKKYHDPRYGQIKFDIFGLPKDVSFRLNMHGEEMSTKNVQYINFNENNSLLSLVILFENGSYLSLLTGYDKSLFNEYGHLD